MTVKSSIFIALAVIFTQQLGGSESQSFVPPGNELEYLANPPAAKSRTTRAGTGFTISRSGGQGGLSESFSTGSDPGRLTISYEMYSIRDGITVSYGARTLFSSGLVQGAGGRTLLLDGSAGSINISINAPQSGTAWNFSATFTPGKVDLPITGEDGTPEQEKTNPDDRKDSEHADPVDTGTGSHTLKRRLIGVQGARRLDFIIDYDSLLTLNGPVGRGWSHNYEAKVVPAANGALRLEWNSKRANTFAPASTVGEFGSSDDRTRFGVLKQLLSSNAATAAISSAAISSAPPPSFSRQTGMMEQTVSVATGGRTEFTLIISGLPAGVTLFNATGADGGNPILKVQNTGGLATVPVQLSYYHPQRLYAGLQPVVALQGGGISLQAAYLYEAPDQSLMRFDTQGRLMETQNASGQVIDLAYDLLSQPLLATKITERISGRTLSLSYNSLGKLTSVTDPLGRNFTFNQDLDDRLLSIRTTLGPDSSTETFSYNSTAQIVSARSNEGTTIFQNTYDTQGRVVTQRDARAGTTRFTYDEITEPGFVLTTATDRLGKSLLYKHDRKYRLISRRDQNGNVMAFEYDASGKRTALRAPLGRNTTLGYDAAGNLTSVTDPSGATSTMAYDSKRNLLSATNAAGKNLGFAYDAANNLTTVTDPFAKQSAISYGAGSLPEQIVNPLGGITKFTYQQGLPSKIEQVGGTIIDVIYDAKGRISKFTTPAGEYLFAYDLWDNLVTVTDPLARTAAYLYDSRHRLIKMTDALGAVTTYEYDGNSNLTRMTDALGQQTVFAYDAEDRLISATNARGKITTYAYDDSGFLRSVTDPLGNKVQYERDAADSVTGVIDALNARVTTIEYDARRLPTKITDALSRVQSMQYNNLGLLTQYVDGLTRSTRYAYDELQRLSVVTDALSQDSGQTFDVAGNPAGFRNAKGNNTAFAFDVINRYLSTTTPTGRQSTVTYNNRNLIQTATEPSGQSASFSYDAANQLSSYQDPTGTIAYTYDAVGRVKTITEAGKTISRDYDALGRLSRFVNSEGEELRYAYDANGNLTTLTYPDGKQVTYAYDNADRMISVTDWAGRITTYTYDANGRATATAHANGTRRAQTYDAMGQLTSITETGPGNAAIVSFVHTYDNAGQLVRRNPLPALTAFNPAPATMTYDADDRMTTFNTQAVAHDADGNMTNGPLESGFGGFAYDSRNRLTSAGGVSYTYDAEGRRLSMTTGAGKTSYTINPLVKLSQILVKRDPSGAVTRYVYGLGLIYEETGTATRTYHYDHLGSTVALTDASGNVTGRVEYGPYGELSQRTGSTATPFLFNGRFGVLSDPNGLYHMRARFYSPLLRRFINSDPIGLGGDSNLYAYASGNPISFIDPFGLETLITIGYTEAAAYAVHGNYHTFIIVSDTVTGEQYITRGGPSVGSGSAGGSGFGFGSIYATYGNWNESQPKDKPSLTVDTQVVGNINKPYDEVVANMQEFANITNQNRVPYWPSGSNSNSYAFTFLESIGFNRPTPILDAMGWDDGRPDPSLSYLKNKEK